MGPGERVSLVVFDRVSWSALLDDLEALEGRRWDVDRSRVGVSGAGGAGAGL